MSIVTQGIRDLVKKAIADNKVMVFSKSYCPYCMRAKDLFDDLDVDYKAIELNEVNDGEAIQKALAQLTKQNTVPNIFIGQKHVGGADALNSLFASGKLKTLLNEAGISDAKL
ncbi:glutaredoxin [Mycotypha africana]|uniref:glutaredoxin n=1 Tax=Mycotypha africana TaxID=64632 RepID=UPI002300FE3A|nr:glutaredoxin [Mycotypha africana]KAI8971799.1 glutaredoxin [Mycotypha africana]